MKYKFLKIEEAIKYYEDLIPRIMDKKEDWCFLDTTHTVGLFFDGEGNYLEDVSFGLEKAYEDDLVWKVAN